MRGSAAVLFALVLGAAAMGAFRRPTAARAAVAPAQPELFAEGVISTPDDEIGITFTPDGKTVYFGKQSRTTTTTPISVICVSHFGQGRWSTPEIAPFSGFWHDLFPAVSADGGQLFFTSDRPIQGRPKSGDPDDPDLHLWVVDRIASGWGPPRPLGPPIESPGAHEQAASLAADGTLYFSSDRPGGTGRYRLYRARPAGGRFAPPEALAELNGPGWESQPAVSPDQSLLVFASAGRPDAPTGGGARYPRADLYVSARTAAGWSPPRNLGPPINSSADEGGPSFSPDGRTLYFTSERGFISVPMPHPLTARELAAGLASTLNGAGNIYRVDIGMVRAAAGPTGEAGR
jgi:hypothetical protein